ncbi:MAG: 50S ribosomal protein L18 [Deltaproteobacteria bacterium]|nr:50S ribosomal protein L18 [Deltaproteobacteria bacterium]
MIINDKKEQRLRKKRRIRGKIFGTPERLRVAVYRSTNHFYAQVIDDMSGKTIDSVSTLSQDFKGKKTSNKDAAAEVGTLLAQKYKGKKFVLDRNGFLYHGRVKAFTDALREGGGVL